MCASGSLAAVLACDNAIPHLLTDAEILRAFQCCHRCLRPGGVAVFSVRDYAAIERGTRRSSLRNAVEGGWRFLAVQVWEWEGDWYDLRIYLTTESPAGACETRVLRSRYYAVTIARLLLLMTEAGFAAVERRDDVLFQPVLSAAAPMAPDTAATPPLDAADLDRISAETLASYAQTRGSVPRRNARSRRAPEHRLAAAAHRGAAAVLRSSISAAVPDAISRRLRASASRRSGSRARRRSPRWRAPTPAATSGSRIS